MNIKLLVIVVYNPCGSGLGAITPSMSGGAPRSQRCRAAVRMITTQTIMITMQMEFTYPWLTKDGFDPVAMGQKLSRTLMNPATSVLIATNESGISVIQAYRARPALMITVVPTASATAASNWLAMPNIGQMVLMLPVQMK